MGSDAPGREPDCQAEDVHVDERLVVAPLAGVFLPAFTDVSFDDPQEVRAGDEIGTLIASGEKHRVPTPFSGGLVGFLVLADERVRSHQPVAWLRPAVMGPTKVLGP